MKTQARVYDLLRRQDVTDKLTGLTFAPGEGGLLLVGTAAEFERDCPLLDEESCQIEHE
jgi:hypothetical protein